MSDSAAPAAAGVGDSAAPAAAGVGDSAAQAAGGGGRAVPSGSELAGTIGRLRRAMRRAARVADPGNELAVAQLELLTCLVDNPGVRPGQLARLLNLRPNSVTTLVNGLTQLGMIDRRPDGTGDRRAVTLHATQDGQRAVHAWQATNSAVLHLALSTLTAPQRRALARAVPALQALITAIDRLADTAELAPDGETTA